jgi:hypothetical protein
MQERKNEQRRRKERMEEARYKRNKEKKFWYLKHKGYSF